MTSNQKLPDEYQHIANTTYQVFNPAMCSASKGDEDD